ncbi:oxygen-independent coproporphyrinogen III oxidase [Stappia sp. F7233]|uniref:Coproporphyrinogen-III oxidase n=1 Tax=Stappia albiluteola TaxID=2758565 RepID=A0A839AGZ2_9HYPH|nr:oxygen-independent coproporphyrinogen III oxidase [Stappia albiluteola]MBA5779130.1 oxygen-independent coproporphyrinogen III oxidase [Stappia albiluteola]
MTQLEHRYATRNVPRYTSYPTAPHFHAGIDGEAYAGWLAGLDSSHDLSLYLHVPYCRQICHYCGCNTKGARKDAPVIAYARTLLAEIDLVVKHLGKGRNVAHIHWGGGTPSLLPADSFLRIVKRLRGNFTFKESLEHAIELDPRTVTEELADRLAAAGVNRASLGVQDFDAGVQMAIGRHQPFSVVERSVEALRKAGIDQINFDLMYGLPHQTRETILHTVELTRLLSPGRVALFGYAHVPWMKKHQRLIDEAALPGAKARIELADSARAALLDAGYEAIGLDHFALADDSMAIALHDGTLRRNFQGYTTDTAGALIGFGSSSIGFLPQGYVQNAPDVGTWTRQVNSDRLPIAKGIALSSDDRARAEIIERLMTVYEADIGAIARKHGLDFAGFAESFGQIGEMVADGLATTDGMRVHISEAGRPYVRVAAATFDAYLARGAARHSVAV